MSDNVAKFDPENSGFKYNVLSDRVFDEKGSTFLAMRRVAWGVKGAEPDNEKAKLELRKWNNRDGKEMPNKGFSFLTEDGPHELTKALLEEGFGNTKDVLGIIRGREDFEESVNSLYDDGGDASGEYFDPRSILFG